MEDVRESQLFPCLFEFTERGSPQGGWGWGGRRRRRRRGTGVEEVSNEQLEDVEMVRFDGVRELAEGVWLF